MALREQQVTDAQVEETFSKHKFTNTNTETDEWAIPPMDSTRPMTPTSVHTPNSSNTNEAEDLRDIRVVEVYDNKEFSHARDFKSIDTDLGE
jgi:hypothetical protein